MPYTILKFVTCFWILSIILFLFKANNVSETGFCLRLQVERTHLGPIDTANPYLQRQTGSIDWTQLLPEDGDRVQTPKRF
jgi:hypothetical protein